MKQRLQGHALYLWISHRLVLHPLLFAAAPILSLVASNLHEISPTSGLRSLVGLIVAAGFGLVLLQRWVPEKQRAAMVASLFLLLFFSYGHVYYGLVTQSTRGLFFRLGLVGNHLALVTAWLGFFIAGVWMTLRVNMRLEMLTRVMNLMAVASMIVPLVQLVHFEIRYRQPIDPIEGINAAIEDVEQKNDSRPDIYYIVLDGYGRDDVLKELYAFDNAPFLSFLEQRGFQVLRESRSNYVQTSLSLASSLNANYLQDVLPRTGSDDPRLTLARMIRDSAVLDFIEQQGYKIVTFASGYRPTELRNADRFIADSGWAVNPLEGLLLETSAFAVYQHQARKTHLPQYYPGYASHRGLVSFTLEKLPETVALPGPKFVFAHIVIPHPPYVFDEAGEFVPQHYRFSFMDGDAFQGTDEEYIRGYRQQLTYLNQRLEAIITMLLARSGDPPIVILQGDHGPGLQLSYQSVSESNLEERLGILNAVFLPFDMRVDLEGDSTPVNTFRYLFNNVFGTEFPRLPDRSYYSTWSEPLDFISYTSLP